MNEKKSDFENALFLTLQKYNWLLPVTDEQVHKFEQDQGTTSKVAPEMPLTEDGSVERDNIRELDVDFTNDIYSRKVAATSRPRPDDTTENKE